MSRPLYYNSVESKVSGLRQDVGRLQKRPLASEWINPANFKDDPAMGHDDAELNGRDLLDEAGNLWTQGEPGHRFRRHADGSIEMRGYLIPGSSGTVAYTLPGAGVSPTTGEADVDYRPTVDTSFIADIKTGPSTFILARVEIDSTTGDVTITYPAS